MLHFPRHPWPLSELSPEDAAAVLAQPAHMRDATLRQLKKDIRDGTHARRMKFRELDRANG